MRLPNKFENILKQNQGLHGAVHSTLSTFEVWLKQNKLPFFPEYTDHSENHVEQVLVAAQALVKEEAWDVISSEDTAVITLATLVHDTGMHLSEDSFVRLVDADSPWPNAPEFEDIPWSQLWIDFLGEASRFDARMLNSLFGDDKPIRKPPLDPQEMTRRDRMLIGEFLRRHHARLGHEIALNGVPSSRDTKFIFRNVPEYIAQLAGMVARSHGTSLRNAVDWLPAEQRRETRRTHLPFLMALLRIADYLQIQEERAPQDVLSIVALRSPISQREWKIHGAVKDINNTHDDIEAIYVVAEPDKVKTYLNLVELFKSIQHELDASWSVLGEVYAIHPKLKSLGLSGLAIRRLRSNLDKQEEFSKTVSYVAERVSLSTANAELTSLLIEPLYGDKPEIGVRELLQNAVDACREFEDYCRQNPSTKPNVTDQETQVKIELRVDSSGNKWFEITDQGIGMTVETVKNYFLTVGASFRASDAWKKQHTSVEGKSRILRSGRFGIGALAAFLIGDQVEVTTRHISQPSNRAVTFSFGISDDAIELKYKTARIGTQISIPVTDEKKWERLTERNYGDKESYDKSRRIWEWYYLKDPKVSIVVNEEELFNYALYPSLNSELPLGWQKLNHPGYEVIHWATHSDKKYHWHSERDLVCNGIFVTDRFTQQKFGRPSLDDSSRLFELRAPQLSIFDKEGNLPLNLQRTEAHTLPFEGALRQEIIKDIIAYILVSDLGNGKKALPKEYPLISGRENGFPIPWLLYSPEGMVIADCWLISNLGYERILSSTSNNIDFRQKLERNSLLDTLFAYPKMAQNRYKTWLEQSLELLKPYSYQEKDLEFITGARIAISLPRYEELQTFRKYRKELREKYRNLKDINGWVTLNTGLLSAKSFKFDNFVRDAPIKSDVALAELYFNGSEWTAKEASEVGKVWLDVVGNTVIPFDIEKRRRQLGHSFEELAAYIQKHLEASERKKSQS